MTKRYVWVPGDLWYEVSNDTQQNCHILNKVEASEVPEIIKSRLTFNNLSTVPANTIRVFVQTNSKPVYELEKQNFNVNLNRIRPTIYLGKQRQLNADMFNWRRCFLGVRNNHIALAPQDEVPVRPETRSPSQLAGNNEDSLTTFVQRFSMNGSR